MIAIFLLFASVSSSLKSRNGATTTARHQLRSRIEPALAKVTYKNREDELARSASSSDRARLGTPLNYFSRTKRSDTTRNASDYYAQRRAVMERYYARQREINARYANRTDWGIPGPKHRDLASQHRPVTRNASLLSLRYPYIRLEPIYSNGSWNRISIEPASDARLNITSETNLDFKSDADLSQARNNIGRNALDYYVTPTPCTNVSLSDTFAPKTRVKHPENCTQETEQRSDCTNNNNSTGNDYQSWGTCEGKIVYQHNLLLGLKGPSNLDTLFEVIIQGPICITCVEVLRYNETRAIVTLDSGGRGHEYAKLRLKGYENEGFSYIIKVWGVKRFDQNVCDK